MIEIDRGQARPAAPPPALRGPGRPVRPADPGPQRRDALLGARDPREGAGLVRRPGPQRPQGRAQLFGLRPGQGARASSWPRPARPRELIDEPAAAWPTGHTFKAYLPGGASGGILPASMGDLPLDFGTLEEHGCFVGSPRGGDPVRPGRYEDAALNLMRFFEDESCGQCTPCRVGCEKAVKLMSQRRLGRGAAGGAVAAPMRGRLDLRPGPGGAQPDPLRC